MTTKLADIVCNNINRVRLEHDLSTRELASRAKMPQKTVHTVCTGAHNPNMSTIDQLCRALFISPQAVVTASMPVNMLMSKRVTKLVERYKVLKPEQRDQLELFLESLLEKTA